LARKDSKKAAPAVGQKGITHPFIPAGADTVAVRLPGPRAESGGSTLHPPVSGFASTGLRSCTQRA